MSLTRRDWLSLAAAGALAAGCAPMAARIRSKSHASDFSPPIGPVEEARRFWHRASFGPRPGDLQAYQRYGRDATVRTLLAADRPEEPHLQLQLMRLDVLRVDAAEMEDLHEETVLAQLQQAALLRAVYGANPLLERMADFWTNHFSIYAKKRPTAWSKGADETNVVRTNALGSFAGMLKASARSPAMLLYLDGRHNRKGKPNENYARELLELHTLGVDGGYTQQDVMEVARCFTGWTIEDRFLRPRGKFRFVPELHDAGEKNVLGHTIPAGGGIEDGEQVLDLLVAHPATARHLARKLVHAFVGTPDERLEERVASAYGKDGQIRPMVREILMSDALMGASPILKRPLDLVASALRALDATCDGGASIQSHLAAMGQPLYQWPMPDGFPTEAEAWSGSMLPRWRFAFALAAGEIGGTELRQDVEPQACFTSLMGREPNEQEAWSTGSLEKVVGLCVASPEFQWR